MSNTIPPMVRQAHHERVTGFVVRETYHWTRIRSRISDYLALAKPGVMSVVVMTTFSGIFLGSSKGALNWPNLFHTIFGTLLAAAGAGALNMLLEMDSDSKMLRTSSRPLPTERILPEEVFFIGSILASLGIVHLSLAVNALTGFLSALSLVLYLVFYTPMKKTSAFCTVVGAAAGAIPPLIGWASVRGSLGPEAWSLFAILFIWQFPHLLALAWMYREDYSRAGFKMMPVPDREGTATSQMSLSLSLLLLAASVVPFAFGLSGVLYLSSALVLGLSMVAASTLFMQRKTRASARTLFLVSIFYIPLLLLFMVTGRWIAL